MLTLGAFAGSEDRARNRGFAVAESAAGGRGAAELWEFFVHA